MVFRSIFWQKFHKLILVFMHCSFFDEPPYQGYDVTPLLPCGLPILGQARRVNPNTKSGALFPMAVWQDNATVATPATLSVPN